MVYLRYTPVKLFEVGLQWDRSVVIDYIINILYGEKLWQWEMNIFGKTKFGKLVKLVHAPKHLHQFRIQIKF